MRLIGRRAFLGGVLAGGGALLAGCRRRGRPAERLLSDASALLDGSDTNRFLREAARPLRGTRLRVLSEDTPPSLVCSRMVREEFAAVTGIEVEWEQLPLEQVFARTAVDTARQAGHYDVFYIDQSWLGQFHPHMERIRPWLERGDLAYPQWDFDDFIAPLVRHTAIYRGDLIALPYDITLFIAAYRRDLLERIGQAPPRNLADWLAASRRLQTAYQPAVYGTTAQWRVGHYALLCNMSTWLWGHGGCFFHADGSPGLGDEAAVAALEYMLELSACMPAEVTTWDWFGESRSFARGQAALFGSWAEFFPAFDDPAQSSIVGLAEPLPMPDGYRLLPASACGFGETPGMSHQGGSGIGMSRYSNHREAAWLFLQWVTSSDVAVRACVLGSGASATRHSVFDDPRLSMARVGGGLSATRHFAVMKDAILNRMGTEPHHPNWPALAMHALPVELGRMVTRQQSPRVTAAGLARIAATMVSGGSGAVR
jgi:multiple sugar transport system substrate-binding protein